MKLADLGEYKVVSTPEPQGQAAPRPMKLSDLGDYKVVSTPTLAEKAKSYGDSALRGAAQGASAGFIDEATAGVGALIDKSQALLGQRGDISLGDAYRTRRDVIRKADEKAANENPLTFGGGAVGGTVLALAAPGPGKALSSGKVVTDVGRSAASALGPLGGALVRRMGTQGLGRAVIAANQAAYAGAGASTADLTKGDVAGVAKDAAIGGVLGAAGSMAADKAASALGGLGNAITRKLGDVAERRAFKAAVGNQQAIYDEAARKGIVNDAGRDLLDRGVVTFGAKAKGIAEKAETARKGVGKEIGSLLGAVDDAAAPAGAIGPTQPLVNTTTIAQKIRDYAQKIGSPGNRSTVENLMRQADEFESMGAVTLKEAQRLKNSYRWDARDPQAMPIGKDASNEIKRIIGDYMDDVVKSAGSAEQSAAYAGAKSSYGNLATAEKGAKKLANRQEKNRTISLSDTIFGAAAGGATLNPLVGAGVAVGNKVLRERGSAAAAVTADKLGKLLSAGAFGKFTPQLESAAKKGPQALVFAHQSLMNDSEYRAIVGAAADDATNAIQRRLRGGQE